MPTDEVLTIKEVSAFLKVTERTIYSLLADQAIPAFKVGGQWRFRRSDLVKWMETRTLRPAFKGAKRS